MFAELFAWLALKVDFDEVDDDEEAEFNETDPIVDDIDKLLIGGGINWGFNNISS